MDFEAIPRDAWKTDRLSILPFIWPLSVWRNKRYFSTLIFWVFLDLQFFLETAKNGF